MDKDKEEQSNPEEAKSKSKKIEVSQHEDEAHDSAEDSKSNESKVESNQKKIEVTEHAEEDNSDNSGESSEDTAESKDNPEPEENIISEESNHENTEDAENQDEEKPEEEKASTDELPDAEDSLKDDSEEPESSQESDGNNEEVDGDDQTVSDEESGEDGSRDTEEDSQIEESEDETPEEELDTSKSVGEAIDESEKDEKTEEEVDKLVDDIVRTESDEVIKETDEKLAALQEKKDKKSLRQKIKSGFVAWWDNKPARYGTFAGLFILFVIVSLLPTTRYATLNLFGVRVASSMTVVDSQTRLPLKNINVSLQDKTSTTNEEGYVEFSGLKLGNSNLKISKIGYADNERNIVLGWGSNPIGEQEIIATGEQFTFVLSDWQSGQPIVEAEASAGENSAKADENGKIVLTVGQENIAEVEVVIEAENYRTEKLNSNQLKEGEIEIKLVSSRKHVFVSNRSGQYDLYKIDIDKQNEEILLESTGKEREVPEVMAHTSRNIVAFVSSRDGDENADGFILDGLFIIDVNSGETKRIARSEQLQLIGWSGDTLVFWQVVEGTSRANPERSKIIAYNERTSERKDLAAANYFNDIELLGDKVFYAVSSYAVPQSQAKLYSIGVDGENQSKLIDKQVWSIFRTSYNRLIFNSEDQKWYEKVNDGLINEIGQQPAPSALKFVNSPNGEKTAWVEVRDGKGVLITSNTSELSENQVISVPGLSQALYWINDTSIVYRVISNSETADYLVDITKNEPIKITDVSATQNRYF